MAFSDRALSVVLPRTRKAAGRVCQGGERFGRAGDDSAGAGKIYLAVPRRGNVSVPRLGAGVLFAVGAGEVAGDGIHRADCARRVHAVQSAARHICGRRSGGYAFVQQGVGVAGGGLCGGAGCCVVWEVGMKHIIENTIKGANIKKIICIYILAYFIVAGMYCGINGSWPVGEWDDYTYPTVTLLTHHQISIYESDLPQIKEYFPEWADSIDAVGINHLSGRYTRNGGTLAYYFPIYALTCIPMICLLKFLGLPAIYAFTFTNLFAIMTVLLIIFQYLQTDDKIKLILIILLSANPIMFYFCWASGETVIYSFLAIGLICWYNKWYKRAAVFISIAGGLNTTIMSIGIIMIAEYMIQLLQKKPKDVSWINFIKKNILDVIGYGMCYSFGLIPMIYFYYNTGYINLTASYEGFLTGKETTFQRNIAYLFDLNFGIFPYFPIVLLMGIFLLVNACIYKHWRYIEWFGAFILNMVLYSIMVHINCGMAGIARYNSWGVLTLIFAVCLFSSEIIDKEKLQTILRTGLWCNIVMLFLIIYQYGPTGANKTSYVYWTPIAKYVIDKYPSAYNPLHSTFNSRTTHQDGGYGYETPIVYVSDDGYVRKILASKKDTDNLKNILYSETDNEWLNEKIDRLEEKEIYISVSSKYKIVTR